MKKFLLAYTSDSSNFEVQELFVFCCYYLIHFLTLCVEAAKSYDAEKGQEYISMLRYKFMWVPMCTCGFIRLFFTLHSTFNLLLVL